MLAAGREVGNYRIDQLVGRGGQGLVYRAVHVRLGTIHALKLLSLEFEPLRERLLGEGRIQAHLRHPNVVPVTDVVEVDGSLALVAEFVEGVPLDAWAAGERPGLAARLAVFHGVCAAVGAAHAARVVHRDLKPANVLVSHRDGVPVARVTDFGVAKLLDPTPAAMSTLPGLPVGTPGYMAPEQLRDASSVDARADLFALGCLLYELTCGVRPFPDGDLATYAGALASGRYVPPDTLVPDLPAGVGRAVEACLRTDPGARPTSVAEVLALLDGTPLPASVPMRTPTRVAFAEGPPPPAFSDAPTRPLPSGAPTRDFLPPLTPVAPPVSSRPPPSAPTAIPLETFPPTLPPATARPAARWPIAALGGILVAGVAALAWPRASTAPDAHPVAVPPTASIAPASPEEAPPEGELAPAPAAPAASTPERKGPTAATVPSVRAAAPLEPAAAATPASPTEAPRVPSPPPERAPATGRVEASGDGKIVWLVDGDARYAPDAAPPGHYTVLVRFPHEEAPVEAFVATVQAGRTTRIKCSSSQLMCVPEEGP